MHQNTNAIRRRADQVRMEVERLRKEHQNQIVEAESFADGYLFENEQTSVDCVRLSHLESENKLYALQIQVLKNQIVEFCQQVHRANQNKLARNQYQKQLEQQRQERRVLERRLRDQMDKNRELQLQFNNLREQNKSLLFQLNQAKTVQNGLNQTIDNHKNRILNLQRKLDQLSKCSARHPSQLKPSLGNYCQQQEEQSYFKPPANFQYARVFFTRPKQTLERQNPETLNHRRCIGQDYLRIDQKPHRSKSRQIELRSNRPSCKNDKIDRSMSQTGGFRGDGQTISRSRRIAREEYLKRKQDLTLPISERPF